MTHTVARMFRASIVLSLLLLAACGSRPERGPAPSRPRNSAPIAITAPPSRETQRCFAELRDIAVRFSALPDRDFGGGCALVGTLQLLDYGVPTTNLKAMTCPLARTFVGWVRSGVVPASREILGSEVVRVESFGSYACRNRVGTATTRLSEHGTANAVDVAAFVLADGRRISIERDWRNPDPRIAEFLQTIRRSACRRFRTVLSPDYNAAHYNHLHFDLGGAALCR